MKTLLLTDRLQSCLPDCVRALVAGVLFLLCCPAEVHGQRAEPTVGEDLVRLERAYDAVRSAGAAGVGADELTELKIRLARRPLPAVAERQQRLQLAKGWKLMAAISRELEGDTDLVAEYYRIASSLDPDDPEVAAELAFRQRKLDAVNERLEEARRLREAAGKKE